MTRKRTTLTSSSLSFCTCFVSSNEGRHRWRLSWNKVSCI